MTIPDTILSQIRATDHWALGAWGTHSIDMSDDALYMRVKGPRFAGEVGVHYHYPSDTYIVRAYRRNESTRERTVLAEMEDVHAEELVAVLDSIVG